MTSSLKATSCVFPRVFPNEGVCVMCKMTDENQNWCLHYIIFPHAHFTFAFTARAPPVAVCSQNL